MLQITDSAKEYLTSMTESERKRFAYLSVLGGGCSGFQYKWDMIDDEKDGIVVEDILVVDKIAEMFVLGSFTWGEKVSENTQIEKKFERLSAWKNELTIRLGH